MSLIGFFICIWYLIGGIVLYYKTFVNGGEYFSFLWVIIILTLTKLYKDEIFFWPKIQRNYTKLILHISSNSLLLLSFISGEFILIPFFVFLYFILFFKLHNTPSKDHTI